MDRPFPRFIPMEFFFLQVLTKVCWSFCKLLGNWASNATTVRSESSHLLCYLVADESEFNRRPDGDQMASGGRESQYRPSHGQYINFNSAIHICVHIFVYSWFAVALMWPFNACDNHVVLFHMVDTWLLKENDEWFEIPRLLPITNQHTSPAHEYHKVAVKWQTNFKYGILFPGISRGMKHCLVWQSDVNIHAPHLAQCTGG